MKKADIKVGDEYAVGSSNTYPHTWERARVLEVGVKRERGWGQRHDPPPGAKVVYLDDKGKVRTFRVNGTHGSTAVNSTVFALRAQVRRPWSEHQAILDDAARSDALYQEHAERQARGDRIAARKIAAALDQRRIARDYGDPFSERFLDVTDGGYCAADTGTVTVTFDWLASVLGIDFRLREEEADAVGE